MSNRAFRATAALGGGAAALVFAVGLSHADAPTPGHAASSSITAGPDAPAPPGGALRVHPAGGGGCVIGLNCGCIANITCPKPPRHPPGQAADPKHAPPAPAPQNP